MSAATKPDVVHCRSNWRIGLSVVCGASLGLSLVVAGPVAVSAEPAEALAADSDISAGSAKKKSVVGLRIRDKNLTARAGKKRVFIAKVHKPSAVGKVRLQRLTAGRAKDTASRWKKIKTGRPGENGRVRFSVRTRPGAQVYRVVIRHQEKRHTSEKVPFKGLRLNASDACPGDGHLNSCVAVENQAQVFSGPNTLSTIGLKHLDSDRTHGYPADVKGNKIDPPDELQAGQRTAWQYRNCGGCWTGIDVWDSYSPSGQVIPSTDYVKVTAYQAYSGGTNTSTCETQTDSYFRCVTEKKPAEDGEDVSAEFRLTTAPTVVSLSNNLDTKVNRVGSPSVNLFAIDPKGESSNSGALGKGDTAFYGMYRTNSDGNSFAVTYKTDENGPFGGGQFVVSVVIDKDTMNKDLSTCKYQPANTMTASCDLAVSGTGAGLTVTLNLHS